jgi:pSer/pThr/pTyr-binding forkhead associated (FHA) protein
MAEKLHLIPTSQGPPVVVDRSLLVVGRHPECDVRIESRRVSRLHCCVALLAPGKLLIRDLGSTNGTFVNNTRVRESMLRPGDKIRIGDVEYSVQSFEERSDDTAAGSRGQRPQQAAKPEDSLPPLEAELDEPAEPPRVRRGAGHPSWDPKESQP